MGTFLHHFLVLLAALHSAASQIQDRIVGGIDGDIANYPWQVNLRYQNAPACGGSIISAQWIMTACHCFPTEHDIKDYDVIAGTTNLDPTDANTQTVLIEAVYKNPTYNEDSYSGDVALVKLKSPLTLTSGVGTISLLAAGVQIPAGLTCYVTGWGNTQQGVSLPNPKHLQVGQVKVISSRTCQCLHSINPSSSEHLTTIQSDMLCAGYKDGTTDACQGDSGGPLACNINSKWYQVGVVSWGDQCAAKNRPGVYILPSAYIDWIRSHVADCQVDSITIDQPPVPDNENGCLSADGVVGHRCPDHIHHPPAVLAECLSADQLLGPGLTPPPPPPDHWKINSTSEIKPLSVSSTDLLLYMYNDNIMQRHTVSFPLWGASAPVCIFLRCFNSTFSKFRQN